MDHPVRNSTNNTVIESEVSEEVSDENTEPIIRYKQTEICKHVNLGNRRNLQRRQRRLKNTEDNTKCAAQVFERKMSKYHKLNLKLSTVLKGQIQ